MEKNSFSGPNEDRCKFAMNKRNCSDRELVRAFNQKVSGTPLIHDRTMCLHLLVREFLLRDFNCSAMFVDNLMNLQHQIPLVGARVMAHISIIHYQQNNINPNWPIS